jgi:positive regulator of sigma E activity
MILTFTLSQVLAWNYITSSAVFLLKAASVVCISQLITIAISQVLAQNYSLSFFSFFSKFLLFGGCVYIVLGLVQEYRTKKK